MTVLRQKDNKYYNYKYAYYMQGNGKCQLIRRGFKQNCCKIGAIQL